MILSWGVCGGVQEPGAVYEMATGRRDILGWQDFIDAEGNVSQFPIYSDFALVVVGETPDTSSPVVDLELEPGEIQYVQITAVDPAGNRDTGECPDDR